MSGANLSGQRCATRVSIASVFTGRGLPSQLEAWRRLGLWVLEKPDQPTTDTVDFAGEVSDHSCAAGLSLSFAIRLTGLACVLPGDLPGLLWPVLEPSITARKPATSPSR